MVWPNIYEFIPNYIGQLIISDLETVHDAVRDARLEWFNIGLELGLSMSDLYMIKGSHRNRVDQCFSEMLTLWLQRDPSPTWSALIGALQSPAVRYNELAKRVEREVIDSGPATEVQVGEFIGWHTCEYCIMLKVSDKIILGI